MRSGFIFAIMVLIISAIAVAFSAVAIFYISRLRSNVTLTQFQVNAIFFTQIVALVLFAVLIIWAIFALAFGGSREVDDIETYAGNVSIVTPPVVSLTPAPGYTREDVAYAADLAPGTVVQDSQICRPTPVAISSQPGAFIRQSSVVTDGGIREVDRVVVRTEPQQIYAQQPQQIYAQQPQQIYAQRPQQIYAQQLPMQANLAVATPTLASSFNQY